MRHYIMLVLGLLAILSVSSMLIAAERQRTNKEDQPTVSHGIETQRVEHDIIQTDLTGKGAVLCSWGILEAAREVGLECRKGQDVAFQAELQQSISRIDDFIIVNSKSPVTRAGLEKQRIEGLKQLHSFGNFCVGDAAKMYDAIRNGGVTALQAQTTELLSVSREPVMNPCL